MTIQTTTMVRGPEKVKALVINNATSYTMSVLQGHRVDHIRPTSGMKGLLVSLLNRYAGDDEHRYLVLGFLFGQSGRGYSSRHLSESQWFGLWQWAVPYKDNGQWQTKLEFPLEVQLILTQALQDRAQLGSQAFSELDTAVALGGIVTATLRDDGAPDVNEDIEVRAILEEVGYNPLAFLDKMKAKGYYKPKEEGGKND